MTESDGKEKKGRIGCHSFFIAYSELELAAYLDLRDETRCPSRHMLGDME
jgi:hypothetical protein